MAVECLEDRKRQHGVANGFEAEQNHGPLERGDFLRDAGVGAVHQLQDAGGEGGIAADELDDARRRLFLWSVTSSTRTATAGSVGSSSSC
jgi:hypothetical protein